MTPRSPRAVRHIGLIVAVVAAASTPARAQTPSAQPAIKTFAFDHYLQKDGATTVTELKADQEFKIVLAHTCEHAFEYSVFKSPHLEKPRDTTKLGADSESAPRNPVTTVTKGPIAHESRWGSYILQVKLKSGSAGTCDVWIDANGTASDPPQQALVSRDATTAGGKWEKDVLFKTAMYIVAVETDQWDVGADAALVVTPGVDRKFTTAVAPAAAGAAIDPARKVVARDREGESAGRISFGTLTHFYFPGKSTGPALGFSVLSAQSNQTEYYFGWGFGLGPKASRLNAAIGAAYTAVPTLPAGIAIGDPITDVSTITSLRSVYKWRFFFSFTSTLFRTGGSTGKPPAPNP